MSAKKKAVKKPATKAKAARKPKRKAMSKSTSAKPSTKKVGGSATLGGLTAAERTHLAELIEQGRAIVLQESTDSVSVYFYVQDGVDRNEFTGKVKRRPAFTVAMVAVGGELKGIGVAKVNPKDDVWDEGRGRMVALARAVRGEARLQ